MNNDLLPLRVTLDQWRILHAVIECGGFSQAAQALRCSQSSVSYSLARLQEQLGIPLLRLEGRKAVLTEKGQIMLRRSRVLLQQAGQLEGLAQELQQGWEAEISLAVDACYPSQRLIQAIQAFGPASKGCGIRLYERVQSGVGDSFLEGEATLAISPLEIPGYPSVELGRVSFVAVAHPSHPLHALARRLSMQDLAAHTQIVVEDSRRQFLCDGNSPETGLRWMVNSLSSALQFVTSGLGFCWLPSHLITHELEQNLLRPLPLMQGSSRRLCFYLYTPNTPVGPATETLLQLIRQYATDPILP